MAKSVAKAKRSAHITFLKKDTSVLRMEREELGQAQVEEITGVQDRPFTCDFLENFNEAITAWI